MQYWGTCEPASTERFSSSLPQELEKLWVRDWNLLSQRHCSLAEGKGCPVTTPDSKGRFWKAELGPVSAQGTWGQSWPCGEAVASACFGRKSFLAVCAVYGGHPQGTTHPNTPTSLL